MIDVSRIPSAALKRIDRLLSRIATSELTWVCEGEAFTGREAADHLRRKLAEVGPQVKTLDEFIETIASRSSVTGQPYRIRHPDGTTTRASEWLGQRARELAEEPHGTLRPDQR